MSKKREFWQSAKYNTATFLQYYNRLVELSIAMFEWKNVPPSVDTRFLELTLFAKGQAVFLVDEVMGPLALQVATGGRLSVYNIPMSRRAIASNGYNNPLTEDNSVLIFNNMLHTPSMLDVQMFALRLSNLDRIIDVNADAQKTPVLIRADERQRLTLLNLYKQYDGNEPFIFADKALNTDGLTVLKTDAPYIADKIYTLKTQIWNEALTYLGISNINVQKKERLITDEVTRNQGGTIASRYSRLESRREACKKINDMFGLNMWCDYREEYQSIDGADDTINGEPDSDGEGGEVK